MKKPAPVIKVESILIHFKFPFYSSHFLISKKIKPNTLKKMGSMDSRMFYHKIMKVLLALCKSVSILFFRIYKINVCLVCRIQNFLLLFITNKSNNKFKTKLAAP